MQAEKFSLALQHLRVILIVNVKAILGKRPDLFLHHKCLLAIDAERGDDTNGMGQRSEHNGSGMMRHDRRDVEEGGDEREAVWNGCGCMICLEGFRY